MPHMPHLNNFWPTIIFSTLQNSEFTFRVVTFMNTLCKLIEKNVIWLWSSDLMSYVTWLQKLQILETDKALQELGLVEHQLRFTSTVVVNYTGALTSLAESVYELLKRFVCLSKCVFPCALEQGTAWHSSTNETPCGTWWLKE